MATNLTTKTIPKKVRDYLGLKAGAPSATDTLAINPLSIPSFPSASPVSKNSRRSSRRRHWFSQSYLAKPCFSRARYSSDIGAVVEQNTACRQISTSARTRLSCNGPC
jgi:hypothetical protein